MSSSANLRAKQKKAAETGWPPPAWVLQTGAQSSACMLSVCQLFNCMCAVGLRTELLMLRWQKPAFGIVCCPTKMKKQTQASFPKGAACCPSRSKAWLLGQPLVVQELCVKVDFTQVNSSFESSTLPSPPPRGCWQPFWFYFTCQHSQHSLHLQSKGKINGSNTTWINWTGVL